MWTDRQIRENLGFCRLAIGDPKTPEGRNYLREERGIDLNTECAYRLGYIKPGYTLFGDSWSEGRIVVPLFDVYDRLHSLTTRPIQGRMFWHSTFPKREHLFGINVALPFIVESDAVVVVEGQFDAMKMYQAGIRNVVAKLGTGFSHLQMMTIMRYTTNVVFFMDGDDGGKKQLVEIKKVVDSFGREVTAAYGRAAPGLDPDSMITEKGVDEVREVLTTAIRKKKRS